MTNVSPELLTVDAGAAIASLETDGVAVLPGFLAGDPLRQMQRAFESRLHSLRWNDVDGYERTERFRHMVHDVLTLEQGFVDAALHPLVVSVLRAYVGDNFELVEAKGWKSLPTRRMFHGWHGDAWYDQQTIREIPREIKLAFYLTDVKTGAFQYIRGTHRKYHPRLWKKQELGQFASSDIVTVAGPAGTAFLFDTSGIHGQSSPILEPRQAIFYNYHDPSVWLQREDVEYYRYHPLILNAAFLGDLSREQCRILGFGNKTNYIAAFQRKPKHLAFQRWHNRAFSAKLTAEESVSRLSAKLKKLAKFR